MPQKVEISAKTIVFTVFFLLFLKIIWQIRDLLYALFFAFILMSALKPPVRFLEKNRVPRSLAVIFVFFSFIFTFFTLFFFVLPPVIKESFLFLKSLPSFVSNLIPNASNFINFDALTQFLPNLTENLIRFITSFFSNFIFIISIIFFTFYFLLEEKFLKKFLVNFLEEKKAERIVLIFDEIEKRLNAWFWGQLSLMVIIGAFSYIGLTLLNIRYALPLAVIAGLLEVVPIIGPTIATVPAFFVAASTSWFVGLSVIALYFLIQQVENNLLVPLVMKKAVGLNPITSLIALTIGGKIAGFLGVLIAIPLAVFLETLVISLIKLKKGRL